jgi:metal-responsive CopG/Arc/MetJ family transcriptional regulator
MRVVIELPDNLLRRMQALAARRGVSAKSLIIWAVEREVNAEGFVVADSSPHRSGFPLVHLRSRRKLDLSKFDFDDLLA